MNITPKNKAGKSMACTANATIINLVRSVFSFPAITA
jgi:hypothetical protein